MAKPDGELGTLSFDSNAVNDDSDGTTSHPGCWLIPIRTEGITTLALITTGTSVTMMGRPLYQKHIRCMH